ncbi:dTDP-4-dehydrorhamnose 3,5-epimerase [Erythrobacter sp. Dej080120_24]|uniref:dTDP-4-dehydrorhamnose 3,5-epimerase n=1 Tax=Erythrobacter sp. Dej080120_24 TaxID=3024837 RepID=UPI00291EDFF1|nr:dTDP-4-dehydrorhamnose 3,5-epimerase [Erythrobacter sp. Dej080120_24]
MLDIQSTALSDVLILTPRRFGDDRGWFCETWNAGRMREHGLDLEWVQDNHSFSADVGTMRGLHYQAPPRAQDKLVRCSYGAIRDVVVDVRNGSPTYGQWVAIEISAEDGRQILIPKGFLHGFVTTAPNTEVQYKVTDFYVAECDGSVRWDSLGIDWGLDSSPILSDKDLSAPPFDGWDSPFIYEKTK